MQPQPNLDDPCSKENGRHAPETREQFSESLRDSCRRRRRTEPHALVPRLNQNKSIKKTSVGCAPKRSQRRVRKHGTMRSRSNSFKVCAALLAARARPVARRSAVGPKATVRAAAATSELRKNPRRRASQSPNGGVRRDQDERRRRLRGALGARLQVTEATPSGRTD